MREIKFRAWDKELKIMDYGNGELTGYNNFDCSPLKTVNDIINENYPELEWMQYTGLKDENSKEIYEGDIVYCKESNIVCKVIFSDCGMFMLKWHDTEYGDGEYYYYGLEAFTLEVIGNIYENPNLLEEQN